jgi:hypothetical protein
LSLLLSATDSFGPTIVEQHTRESSSTQFFGVSLGIDSLPLFYKSLELLWSKEGTRSAFVSGSSGISSSSNLKTSNTHQTSLFSDATALFDASCFRGSLQFDETILFDLSSGVTETERTVKSRTILASSSIFESKSLSATDNSQSVVLAGTLHDDFSVLFLQSAEVSESLPFLVSSSLANSRVLSASDILDSLDFGGTLLVRGSQKVLNSRECRESLLFLPSLGISYSQIQNTDDGSITAIFDGTISLAKRVELSPTAEAIKSVPNPVSSLAPASGTPSHRSSGPPASYVFGASFSNHGSLRFRGSSPGQSTAFSGSRLIQRSDNLNDSETFLLASDAVSGSNDPQSIAMLIGSPPGLESISIRASHFVGLSSLFGACPLPFPSDGPLSTAIGHLSIRIGSDMVRATVPFKSNSDLIKPSVLLRSETALATNCGCGTQLFLESTSTFGTSSEMGIWSVLAASNSFAELSPAFSSIFTLSSAVDPKSFLHSNSGTFPATNSPAVGVSDRFAGPSEEHSDWFRQGTSAEANLGAGISDRGGISTVLIAVLAAFALLMAIAAIIIFITIRRRKKAQSTDVIYDIETEFHGDCLQLEENEDSDEKELSLALRQSDVESMVPNVSDDCDEAFVF